MIASIFNTLALAYVANAAIVLETLYETQYYTVTGGVSQTVDAVTSTSLPATTHVSTDGYDFTLTLDAFNNYEFVASSPVTSDSSDASATSSATASSESSAESTVASSTESSASSTSASSAESTTTAASSTTLEASSTTSSSSSTATSTLSSFASECLSYHNQVRAVHQAPDMAWNETLASYAENYLDGNCNFAHSGGPYGENIAMGYSSATAAMEAWYNEYVDYDYSAAEFTESTGHFTQMVWVSTLQLGCYQSDCGSSGNYLVCEYADERGNIIGYFSQNVLPATTSS